MWSRWDHAGHRRWTWELVEVLLWAGKIPPGGCGLLCDWGKNWGDTEVLKKKLSLNMGPANRLKEFDTSMLYEWNSDLSGKVSFHNGAQDSIQHLHRV